MIKTEAIETLDGSVKINLANLVVYDPLLNQLKTSTQTIVINGAGGGDTTPPSSPVSAVLNYIDNVGATQSETSTSTTTDDNTPGFRIGTLPADATEAILFVDNTAVLSTYSSTTGIIIPNSAILDGAHIIKYAWKDQAGNISGKSPGFSITISTGGTIQKVRTPDTELTILPAAIDLIQDNNYLIEQDVGQPNWSEYQLDIIQNDFSLAAGAAGTALVSKIKMNIRSVGYQMVKILLYDKNNNIITFKRSLTSKSVERSTDSTMKIEITSNGFMLVDNATYELANIFNTDKLPAAGVAGWYSVTSNTDATASFEAICSTPIEVSKIRIYRCGGSSASFNGGSDPYDILVTDNSNKTYSVVVPKVSSAEFATITAFKEEPLDSSGGVVDISTKVHNFSLSVSTNGIDYETLVGNQTSSQNQTTGLYTVVFSYPNKIIDSRKLYIKLPDTDIPFLKNVVAKQWYLV